MLAITGSSGFIGKALSKSLPFPQKRLIRQSSSVSSEPDVQVILGDLKNSTAIETLVEESDALIHLAWGGSPRTPFSQFNQDIQEYLIPTLQLFRSYAEKNPGGHIVFTSSGGNIYGASPKGNSFSEDNLPHPLSSYSLLKLNAENYLPLLCSELGIRATIMRISNPYGTLLPGTRGQGLIGVAFSKLLADEPLTIFEDPETVRDYLHLFDLTKAFQAVLASPPKIGECKTYNVSSAVGHSIHEVLELIEKTSGKKLKKTFETNNHSHALSPKRSVLSYDKIHRELGWQPELNLEDGLNKMWHHLKPIATKI